MPRSRSWNVFAAAAVLAIAVVGAVALLNRRTEHPAQATPRPGIAAVATDVETVPKLPTARRLQIVSELGAALTRLYTVAFVSPEATPAPASSPRIVEDRLKTFFTPKARAALASDNVFRLQKGLELDHGRIGFSGVVTIEGADPVQALLDVDFLSVASQEGDRGPQVRVHQQGTISLVRAGQRWLVEGFDLRFATKPIPSPTPTDRA
jgi:hypothetical protein